MIEIKAKKAVEFAVLFALLTGFSAASIGLVNADSAIIKAVSADESSTGTYVVMSEQAFDSKVLWFLRNEVVCALSEEEAAALGGYYPTEEKTFEVDGNEVDVLYVEGTPLNKNIVEETLGITFGEECNVVHGNKIIAALITPVFVS